MPKWYQSTWFKITLGALALAYIVIQSLTGGDFKIYLGAAELIKNGESCYNTWIDLGGEKYGKYSYGVFFAVLLIL